MTGISASSTFGRRFVAFGSEAASLVVVALFVPVAVLVVGTPVVLAARIIIELAEWLVGLL
jgi:hypothetical protein